MAYNRRFLRFLTGKQTGIQIGMDVFGMEPMLPEEAAGRLEDGALTLVAEANRLAGRVHPILLESAGTLVRSMNGYYSNLIEGHDTHPRDIDRALANDFSAKPRKRELQQEAVAHIRVQRLIDEGRDPDIWSASADYVRWLHREFCGLLPPEMLAVDNPTPARGWPSRRAICGTAMWWSGVMSRLHLTNYLASSIASSAPTRRRH